MHTTDQPTTTPPPTTTPDHATTTRGARAGRWVKRWGDEIDPAAVAPGVYKRKAGGFRVRGRVTDPRTGRLREVCRAVDAAKPRDAAAILAAELDRVRAAVTAVAPAPRFGAYAVTAFERRIADGRILSAAGRGKWASVLRTHLVPAFGEIFLDRLTASDIEAWKATYAARIRAGEATPGTGNTIFAVLRAILREAAGELDLRDPSARVRPFDTRGHRTYTPEAPNSLAPVDVPRFLDAIRARYPQHFAFVFLGFVTGLRPSSLRPLRRNGRSADLDLATGVLLIRRSHTRGAEVMESTKTARDQRIQLPAAAVDVLRWHCDRLTGAGAASDLLFPADSGQIHTRTFLEKPFATIGRALGLAYPVSPRAMRRTYQDLAREAAVSDVVTRAISGHSTEAMQRHYSTARDHEVAAGLAKVIDLATARRGA